MFNAKSPMKCTVLCRGEWKAKTGGKHEKAHQMLIHFTGLFSQGESLKLLVHRSHSSLSKVVYQLTSLNPNPMR